MHIRIKHRLSGIIIVLLLSISGVYVILSRINNNIVFFYPPSEIHKTNIHLGKIRVGGIVKIGSVKKCNGNTTTIFTITDHVAELTIEYKGALPTLFREQQGVVAEGSLLNGNLFIAQKLMIKHDEKYIPPELAKIKMNQ